MSEQVSEQEFVDGYQLYCDQVKLIATCEAKLDSVGQVD